MPDTAITQRTILMLCAGPCWTSHSNGLLRDLADAIVENGTKLKICLIDWSDNPVLTSHLQIFDNGLEVLTIPPWRVGRPSGWFARASKWLGSSFNAVKIIKQHYGSCEIDLLLGFSPLLVTGRAIGWSKRHYKCRAFAYLTDFFPYHQSSLKLPLGGKIGFRIALAFETLLLRKFETVACMSPTGVEFVKSNYNLRDSQQVELLYLWGTSSAPVFGHRNTVKAAYDLPLDRPIALFGGQITEGRGIEEILQVARKALTVRPDLIFIFMGRGRLEPLIREHISGGLKNVMLKAPVSRDDYLNVVNACDIGIVSTVADTGIPSFPSKTIDYLRAGVPIVASVEATTDYSDFVRDNGIGIAVTAGNPDIFLQAMLTIIDDKTSRARMAACGQIALKKYFSVENAAASICGHIEHPQA